VLHCRRTPIPLTDGVAERTTGTANYAVILWLNRIDFRPQACREGATRAVTRLPRSGDLNMDSEIHGAIHKIVMTLQVQRVYSTVTATAHGRWINCAMNGSITHLH
jgi:hypothetical protein